MSSKTISMPLDEALERRDALVRAVLDLVTSRRELTDVVLDALLTAYLVAAEETGRLPEVPKVLRSAIASIENESLTQAMQHPTQH